MRDLVEDDSNGGADAEREALRNGRSYGQSVGKVMETVSHDDEPGQRLDAQNVATNSTKFTSLDAKNNNNK